MADPTKTTLPAFRREHRALSQTIGTIVVLALLAAIAVEVCVFVSFDGETNLPSWVTPVRLLPWLIFFLTAMGWVTHSLSPPTVKAKSPTSRSASPSPSSITTPEPVELDATPRVARAINSPFLCFGDYINGRNKDREKISAWMKGGMSSLLVIVARGGVGKSALAWLWMHHDILEERLEGHPADGRGVESACRLPENRKPMAVFWWSFEEGGSSFLMMLDGLVDFLANGREVTARNGSRTAKLDFVIDELTQRNVLLILDGFEYLLQAYAYPLSHYHADRLSVIKDGLERRCADPLAAEFLTRVGHVRLAGKVVLTTRHLPVESEPDQESAIQPDIFELGGLEPADALAWMDRAGMIGDRARLHVLARICQGRPMALKVAIGMAKSDALTPGDVGAVIDHSQVVKQQSPHHVLKAAMGTLDKNLRELLSRLSAVRGTISRDLAEMISPIGKGSLLDEGLGVLLARGFINISQDRRFLAVHSLVRSAAYERLPDVFGFHAQLEKKWGGASADAPRLEGLRAVIERYHHLAASGKYDQARELFRDGLYRSLVLKHGDFALAANLLRALFSNGTSSAPTMEKGSSNAATVRLLSDVLMPLGEPREAATISQLARERSNAWKTHQTADIDLLNLAEASLRVGQLRRAEEAALGSISACQAAAEELRLAMGKELLARLYLVIGKREEGKPAIEAALQVARRWNQPNELAACLLTRADYAIEEERPQDALMDAEEAFQLVQAFSIDGETLPLMAIRAERTLALCFLAQGRASGNVSEREKLAGQAQDRINSALRLAWRRNVLSAEPELRWLRATVYRLKNQGERALREAQTAVRLARRMGMGLVEADALLLTAELHRAQGKPDLALGLYERTREMAWGEGPPYTYKRALAALMQRQGAASAEVLAEATS